MAAAPAVLLSQILVIASFRDARFGTIPNLVVLAPLALTLLDLRSSSFPSRYRRDVALQLSRSAAPVLVTDGDLEGLPPQIQTFLRRARVVGKPRVHDFRARFRMALRSSREAPWMRLRVEEHELFDEPARLFYAETVFRGLPIQVFHRYVGPAATMQVRVASLFDVVDAKGPEMNQSETVTLLNDMCVLAPASLLGGAVSFRPTGEHTVSATFGNAGNTVTADLSFDESGDLVGFRVPRPLPIRGRQEVPAVSLVHPLA